MDISSTQTDKLLDLIYDAATVDGRDEPGHDEKSFLAPKAVGYACG